MSNSYLGQAPVFGDFPFQIITGDGGASYTLSYKVSSENGMIVFLNGAVQRPGIDFTAGGDQLLFSENVPVGVQIFTYGMGLPKSTLAPSLGSVGFDELESGVIASGATAQDWTNVLQLLTPGGLADSFKGGNQSLTENGYQKLPGGLIIQWGTVTGSGGTVAFPITFPTGCVSIASGQVEASAAGGIEYVQFLTKSTTNFTYVAYGNISVDASTEIVTFSFTALGY